MPNAHLASHSLASCAQFRVGPPSCIGILCREMTNSVMQVIQLELELAFAFESEHSFELRNLLNTFMGQPEHWSEICGSRNAATVVSGNLFAEGVGRRGPFFCGAKGMEGKGEGRFSNRRKRDCFLALESCMCKGVVGGD